MELKWGPVPVSNGGANRPNRPRTVPMFEIAIPTLLLDVAAVFSGRHGAVTDRAEQAGCSRQTVYDHAQAVDDRLAERDRLRTDVRAELAADSGRRRPTKPWSRPKGSGVSPSPVRPSRSAGGRRKHCSAPWAGGRPQRGSVPGRC